MTAVSFATVSAAVAAVRTDLVAQGYAGPVLLGKQYVKQKRDPTAAVAVTGYGTIAGSVVIVPVGSASPLRAPRLVGGNPRALFTVSRQLSIHCWSQAPLGGFSTQYEADLTAVELLTAAVLRSFEIYVPGAKRGGDSEITDAGENSFGVEIVTGIEIDLEIPDTTYQGATGAVFVPQPALEFTHGSSDPAQWTFDVGF